MGKRRRMGICGYCGQQSNQLTADHVFPQCLFATQPPDSEVVVIKACAKCNGEKSRYDGQLRNLLVIDDRTATHPEAYQQQDTVIRAASKMPRSLRETILNAEAHPLFTQTGLFVKMVHPFKMDETCLPALRFIVKGLFHHATGRIFPENYRFLVTNNELEMNALNYAAQLAEPAYYGPFLVGEDVVRFDCYCDRVDPATAVWSFRFYGSFYLCICTRPPESHI